MVRATVPAARKGTSAAEGTEALCKLKCWVCDKDPL